MPALEAGIFSVACTLRFEESGTQRLSVALDWRFRRSKCPPTGTLVKNEESKNKVGAGLPHRPSLRGRVDRAHDLHGGGGVRRLDVWQFPRCLSRARTDHHASSLIREEAMAVFAKSWRRECGD